VEHSVHALASQRSGKRAEAASGGDGGALA